MSYLQLEGIGKRFGAFTALDEVTLAVEKGSIHALLGENGAGKTTLMNILYGFYQPDSGRVRLGGRELSIASPRQALQDGIGMIHQHFMLVDNLTVLENVILGLPGGLSLKLAQHRSRLVELSARVGLDVDPDRQIWQLPIGMRQRVEILKALYRDVEVLILDEPTSVLAPSEIDAFLQILENLRQMGKTMLFITHKLDEVFRVCDRVTVLRRGQVVGHAEVAQSTPQAISRLMVGRDLPVTAALPQVVQGAVVLQVQALSARNDRGIQALHNVSFEIRAGEVLGIVGVDGNGQAELADTITGMRQAEAGEVRMHGQSMRGHDVASRRKRFKIGYVPEDRHSTGLVLDFSLWENAMLRDHRRSPFSRLGLLSARTAQATARHWCEKYDVRMHSVDQQVRFLSGGNQQKLIFAREVECNPDLLVVMQPCKGLDVGAIEAVQRVVREQRQAGKAVLYISTELEEVMAISDRIGVMCAGQLTGVLSRAEATADQIGALMTSTENPVAGVAS
jgi:simple sugar transport system ATP-binding protein